MSIDAGQTIRHIGMEISVTVQTATGPPVTAESIASFLTDAVPDEAFTAR